MQSLCKSKDKTEVKGHVLCKAFKIQTNSITFQLFIIQRIEKGKEHLQANHITKIEAVKIVLDETHKG